MFKNPFSFKGRIRRKEYILSFILQFMVLINPLFWFYCLINSLKNKYSFKFTKFTIFYYILTFICYSFITYITTINPNPKYKQYIEIYHTIFGVILIISFIFLIWFSLAQTTKRCHDIGNSGWYQLIPFYNLFLLFGNGEIAENEYGINPKES